jgi:hypothetical protein
MAKAGGDPLPPADGQAHQRSSWAITMAGVVVNRQGFGESESVLTGADQTVGCFDRTTNRLAVILGEEPCLPTIRRKLSDIGIDIGLIMGDVDSRRAAVGAEWSSTVSLFSLLFSLVFFIFFCFLVKRARLCRLCIIHAIWDAK